MLPIGHEVRRVVKEAKVQEGWVTVMAPWSGAALTVMENVPEKVGQVRSALESFLANGLGDALLAKSQVVPIHNGDLMIDPWQAVTLIDFDKAGKRRECCVQVYGEEKKEGADGKGT